MPVTSLLKPVVLVITIVIRTKRPKGYSCLIGISFNVHMQAIIRSANNLSLTKMLTGLSIDHKSNPGHRIIILSAGLGALMGLVIAGLVLVMRISAHPDVETSGRIRSTAAVISKSTQQLPPYRLVDLNHQEIPSDGLRHGRVLLVYLTTDCDHCIREAEIISGLQRNAPSDIHIYGVYIERPAQVATFIKEFDLKFPMLIDVGAQLAKSLDIHYFPSKYFIEDGVITETWHGTTQDEAELRQRLSIK